jgi:hypothetical protein
VIEEEEGRAPAEPGRHDAEMLLYDFFKHLTSLALLSLGGMLALAEKARGTESFTMLIAVMATVALAAICSFTGAGEIVASRFRPNSKERHIGFYRVAAPALLSIGVGGFLYMFAKTMVAS